MRADGLYTLAGNPADEWKHPNHKKINVDENGVEIIDGSKKIKVDENGVKMENSSDSYRYNSNQPAEKADSMKQILDKEKQRIKDSLQKAKETIDKQLNKIEDKKVAQESSAGSGTLSSYQMPLFIHIANLD